MLDNNFFLIVRIKEPKPVTMKDVRSWSTTTGDIEEGQTDVEDNKDGDIYTIAGASPKLQ